ncbi:MAG: hypothetical protein ACRCWO_09990 [Bosea sp. (in: a-proteobacteria)]
MSASALSSSGLTATDLLNSAGGVGFVVPDPRTYDQVFKTTVKLALDDYGPFDFTQPSKIGPDGATGAGDAATSPTSVTEGKIGPG